MYARMRKELGYGDKEIAALREIIGDSRVISEGNPDISEHPMKRSECYRIRKDAGLESPKALAELAKKESVCKARYMVPVTGKPDAGVTPVCIDQYEFPDIPCEYPTVYASAKQASDMCRAVGKRLCDAHEWEGACAGELRKAEDEYLWDRLGAWRCGTSRTRTARRCGRTVPRRTTRCARRRLTRAASATAAAGRPAAATPTRRAPSPSA